MKPIGIKGAIVAIGLAVLQLFPSCFATIDVRSKIMDANGILQVDYNGTVLKDLRYGEGEREVYDLYLPEDTTDPKATHLILFIHGGSWQSGSKNDGELWCRNIASKGYTAATISYTLKTDTTDTNIILINNQVRAAVGAIKARCAESDIGITLVDMATHGFSAGACQAMMYGFDVADADPALPVKFILQQSGPSTFEPSIWRNGELHKLMVKSTGLNGSYKADAAWISQFCGEEITEEMVKDGSAEAYWKKVSPYTYITDDSVPILFAYGVLDGIVPPASRLVLQQALDEHNVPYVSIVMEKSGHMLICDPDEQRLFLDYMDKYCAKYFLGEDIQI